MTTTNRLNSHSVKSDSVLISTRGLVKEYRIGRQKIRAISDASLDTHESEFVAIVGANDHSAHWQYAPQPNS